MYAIQQDFGTIRVSALHALVYCPRLFFLEEVEELYTQDAAVFAGRRLHAELERQEEEEWEDLFLESEKKVWLSEAGRRKFIDLYEQRKAQQWKHPVTQYSLSYRRLMELEVRLLEKHWLGEGEVFGQLILR